MSVKKKQEVTKASGLPKLIELIALILANIAPLIAVFFFNWNAGTLVVLYWFENIIIGIFTVAKISVAPDVKKKEEKKLALIPFFIMHYGIFTTVHGFFVFDFFSIEGGLIKSGILLFLAGLFLYHGVNFIISHRYYNAFKDKTPKVLMFSPYPRIIILHISLIFGGAFIMFMGSPTYLLVLMVLIKLSMDLLAFLGGGLVIEEIEKEAT